MKQFPSIEKLDTGILYILELASSVSVLLLAFGLIASMANVLTKGAILTDNLIMQRIWAITQCVGIDAGMSGTIIRAFRFHAEGERVKTWLYGLLSVLLLFTAAIVLNIESVQQTLNLTLNAAYIHVFIPVEALIWIRSIAIVLLIVAHAMRHVSIQTTDQQSLTQETILTPQIVETLRSLILEVTVTQEQETPQIPETATGTAPKEEDAREKIFTQLADLLPDVSKEEKEAVLNAYDAGVQRRNICGHLHWGSSKYSTIVKPVLDVYEQLQQYYKM